MPYINIITDKKISSHESNEIQKELCNAISNLGKSEQWLMINIDDGKDKLYFRNSTQDIAMVQISLFGKANDNQYQNMTHDVTNILSKRLNIPSNRIYVQYIESSTWGFGGENF